MLVEGTEDISGWGRNAAKNSTGVGAAAIVAAEFSIVVLSVPREDDISSEDVVASVVVTCCCSKSVGLPSAAVGASMEGAASGIEATFRCTASEGGSGALVAVFWIDTWVVGLPWAEDTVLDDSVVTKLRRRSEAPIAE